MNDPAALLVRAKAALKRAHGDYRAALLECGRHLHAWIDATLRQELTPHQRQVHGVFREVLIRKAAEEVGIKPARADQLIVTAMVAELLADSQIGDLWHVTVYCFRPFIRRRQGRYALPSEKETWDLRRGFEQTGPALFRRAVAENWNTGIARREVHRLFQSSGGDSRKPRYSVLRRKKVRQALEQIQHTSKVAAPGDVAEMCFAVVQSAEEPKAVAALLIGKLNQLMKARRESPCSY
jgi:AraC-like DNA-binding protein